MTTPHCSIIIRAYNEEQHIGRLLAGIRQQSMQDVELIVVDSGSTDATVAIAREYSALVVPIAPYDFTFGRSLNLGCSHARGEFLVFASAHVYPVYPDWLTVLLHPFADPQVALVYGKQRGNSETRYSEAQQFAKLFPERSDSRQQTPLCNNANAAIRRLLWEERPYDEDLPGLEDLEWANWAVGEGHILAYAAEAEVVHVHDESPRQVYNRYRREAMGLKRIGLAEGFGLWDFLRLSATNIANDIWHATADGRFLATWWEIAWFRLLQFWGTYRGLSYAGPVTRQLIQAFYYPRGLQRDPSQLRREVRPIDYGTESSGAERAME